MAEAGQSPYYVVLEPAPTSRDPSGTEYRGIYDSSSKSSALLRLAVEGDVPGIPGRSWDIHPESSGRKEFFCCLAAAQEFYRVVNGHPARLHFKTRRSCSTERSTCTACAARLRNVRRALWSEEAERNRRAAEEAEGGRGNPNEGA